MRGGRCIAPTTTRNVDAASFAGQASGALQEIRKITQNNCVVSLTNASRTALKTKKPMTRINTMTMTEYDFLLKFDLPGTGIDPEEFVDALFDAGCDDATVGIGQHGRIALNFTREAISALDAVSSAIRDVKKAIPGAKLVEATPDLVGLTDIAEILGCSRQNIRKLAIGHKPVFPSPIHDGSAALWHLAKVLPWFKAKGIYKIEDNLIELSETNMQVNIARQLQDLNPSVRKSVDALRSLAA